jgi:Protein of unknown function (DUF3341)
VSIFLIGEFRDKEPLIGAIRQLRASGIDPEALDLFSAEPVELVRGVLDRPSAISRVAVATAILFGLMATAFIRYTQQDYRMITGGMPLFSFWAIGVITFEMSMLGAIAATFAWFLWESGLLRKRNRRAPVPTVSPGSIFLRVLCGPEQSVAAVEALMRNEALHIQRYAE